MKKKSIVFILLTLFLINIVNAGLDPFVSTRPSSVVSDVENVCEQQLNNAHDSIRLAAEARELRPGTPPERQIHLRDAQAAYETAMQLSQNDRLDQLNKQLAAKILTENAWFIGKLSNSVDQAIHELRMSLAIYEADPVSHYELAEFLRQRFILEGRSDVHLRDESLKEVSRALQLDPEMPEAYWLRARSNAGAAADDDVRRDFAAFIKYRDELRPRLFFYDKWKIDSILLSSEQYVDSFSAIKP